MTTKLRTTFGTRGVAAIFCLLAIASIARARPDCVPCESGSWQFNAVPEARFEHHAAYDAARAQTIIFGGRNAAGVLLNDTWAWDGQRWRNLTPPLSPSPRNRGAMAYDAARQRLVLFAGQTIGGVNNGETWEWDGAAWSMRAVTGPSARWAHTMVYDSALQRVVVFGGQDSINFRDDSWSWDGNAWTQIPTTITPGQGVILGHRHQSSYDAARNRHVLFSVQGGSVTWERAGTVWSLITNSPPPQGRVNGAMVYAPGAGSLLFGGSGGGSGDANLWSWSGSAWSVAQPAAPTGPAWRELHAMAYDSGRGVLVLFGGTTNGTNTGATNEVWEWSGVTGWVDLTAPSPRESHAIAYDPVRREMVLYGGIVSLGGTVSQETWVRSEGRWMRRLTTAPGGMGGRYEHTMAFDERAQRVVLFGGRLQGGGLAGAGMWEWDGISWTTRGSLGPSARAKHAMIYARAALGTGRTVVSGGVLVNGSATAESWAWDGVSGQWQQVGTLPNPLAAHGMSYDARDNVIVAFGGRTSAGTPPNIAQHRTLYRMDANLLGWTSLLPGAGTWPAPRERHAMVFDGSTNTSVMIGGIGDDINAGALYSDAWEWDNRLQQWSLRPMSLTAPPGIRRHASAADPSRAEILVFGGSLSANTLGGGIASSPTQSEWLFTSPRVSRWKVFAGGNYSNAANWECDRLPGVESAIVVERSGFCPALPGGTPLWPVNINVSAAAQAARNLDVRWNSVTFNLLQGLTLLAPNDLADPSLIVGGAAGDPGVLALINTQPSGAATMFSFSAGVIGRDAGAVGTLRASGQRVRVATAGDVIVGGTGTGDVFVEDRAQFMFGATGTHLVIGQNGNGSFRVIGPGARAQSTKGSGISSAIVIGQNAGSTGLLSSSAGAAIFADIDDFVVGDLGSGRVEIVGGNALLQTNSFNTAVVGRGAGSTGVVRIESSEWREAVSVPTLGLGGTGRVELSTAALMGDRGASIASKGEIRGDGVIVGDVFNLGNLWPNPAEAPSSPMRGRIEVQGTYRQIGLPPGAGAGAESGRLSMDLSGAGAGETSELSISGSAQLAGVLRVRLQNGFLPNAGYSKTIVTGSTRNGTTFDVALLPGFPDDRFMRVVYGGPADNSLVSLEVGSLAPRLTTPPAQAAPAPSELRGAVGADINGDGLDDGVLITPGNPGALIVLFSRGVDGSGNFLGFWSAQQYNVGNDSVGVVAAQIDGAPGIDIAVADADGTLRVFTNDNNWQTTGSGVTGSLSARAPVVGLGALSAMAGGDLNGDGLTDLAVTSESAGTLTILRGTGGGDFSAQAPVMLGASSSPRGVDIGDLDNDKDLRRPGIAVGGGGGLEDGSGGAAGRLFVLENVTATAGGVITFAPAQVFNVAGEIKQVSIRNLNPSSPTDRFGEVVAVVQGAGSAAIAVLRNQESTSGLALSPPALLDIGVEATSVATVDLDGDGDPDLASAAKPDANSDRRVRVLRSEVSQGSLLAFSQAPDLQNPPSAPAPALVRAWDISGDGRPDLVAIRPTAGGSEGAPDSGPIVPTIAVRVNRVINGDANRDGVVNFLDLNIVLSFFGQSGPMLGGDVNGDGRVDFLDLNLVLSSFGVTLP